LRSVEIDGAMQQAPQLGRQFKKFDVTETPRLIATAILFRADASASANLPAGPRRAANRSGQFPN
jgi:hypothetical protein